MTKEEAISIFKKITYAYPAFNFDEKIFKFWINELVELHYQSVLKNLKQHIQTNVYPPQIAHLAASSKPDLPIENEFLAYYKERNDQLHGKTESK